MTIDKYLTEKDLNPRRIVFRGFTRGQLQGAFDLVKPKGEWEVHWKDPIKARIPIYMLRVTFAAIAYFTGTEARVTDENQLGQTVQIESDLSITGEIS
jgi:hypothetical protein